MDLAINPISNGLLKSCVPLGGGGGGGGAESLVCKYRAIKHGTPVAIDKI